MNARGSVGGNFSNLENKASQLPNLAVVLKGLEGIGRQQD